MEGVLARDSNVAKEVFDCELFRVAIFETTGKEKVLLGELELGSINSLQEGEVGLGVVHSLDGPLLL